MGRVVVTGIGMISCIGNTLEEVRDSLQRGRSGIEFHAERKELGFRSALGGTLKNFVPPKMPKRFLRQMNQASHLAVSATLQALEDAKLSANEIQDGRTGLIIGNMGNFMDIYNNCRIFHLEGKNPAGTAYLKAEGSMVSASLSVYFGITGHSMTVSAACASGASAIGQAYLNILSGIQDRYICGGVQEESWQSVCLFDQLRAFSVRESEPTKASRPFDANRDGLVPSCGSGIVILEEYEHAKRRGARIRAELAGFGTNADGHDMTIPSGEGSVRCIEMALRNAGIQAEDIDYINAHATGTLVGDVKEAQSIAKVFGDKPYVTSTKSMTGHEVGAAGANELIYTLIMMEHGFIAPNINLDEVDTECRGINIIANNMIEKNLNVAVSNSFGFGGVNTVLIVKRVS
jgi:3-oxoacyl-[acyl-carrier-protein] synthase-1